MSDYKKNYDLLGIDPDSSVEDTKDAYRKLVKRFHPDRLGPNATLGEKRAAEEYFKRIQEAYEAVYEEVNRDRTGERQNREQQEQKARQEEDLRRRQREEAARIQREKESRIEHEVKSSGAQELDSIIKKLFDDLAKSKGRELTQDEKNKILLASLTPGSDMKEVIRDILSRSKVERENADKNKKIFLETLNYRWIKNEIRKKGLLHRKEIKVVVPHFEKINEDYINLLHHSGPTDLIIDILKTDCKLNNMEIQNLMRDQEFVEEMSQKVIDQIIDERLKVTQFTKDEFIVMYNIEWGKDAINRLSKRRKYRSE